MKTTREHGTAAGGPRDQAVESDCHGHRWSPTRGPYGPERAHTRGAVSQLLLVLQRDSVWCGRVLGLVRRPWPFRNQQVLGSMGNEGRRGPPTYAGPRVGITELGRPQ